MIEALQVAELDNYFHDACVAFEHRNIEEIDSSAAVIYTIILPDRLEVILSQGDSILRHHTEHISQTQLEETITQLRQYIVQPDRTRSAQELAAEVYDWLIEPFSADLVQNKTQTLVFVLDNVLQTIPMAVLYDGEHYLVEKYAIALTPGLRLINAKEQDFNSSILGAGVSQSLKVENQRFAALNNVETELNNIKTAFPGKILLNEGFTEDNFVKQLQNNSYSIIHLATHGKFSSNPNNTFLLLWQQLLTINDFNSLLQNRKQAISHPIDLLVLSACETAAGDKRATLGLAGISLRTRAISTLATLWQIGDESTAVLMNDFYQKLSSPKKYTKAQALQQAQIKMIQNPQLGWQTTPSWAAYILVGNWR
jgi:CHAT domain-containing protein